MFLHDVLSGMCREKERVDLICEVLMSHFVFKHNNNIIISKDKVTSDATFFIRCLILSVNGLALRRATCK